VNVSFIRHIEKSRKIFRERWSER